MPLFAADAAPPGLPFWWEAGAAVPALPERPPVQTDVVVIGAGYTGLAAAITAAAAGAAVAVLDAGVPGQGASTRNGGMVGAHPRQPYEAVAARFGAAVADGIYGEAGAAFAFTRGLVKREGIACDWQDTGRIQLAWTRADFEAQKRLVERVTAVSDIRMEIVAPDDLPREIATRRYFGAIRFPDHAALQPRRFHDGMLAAALRHGVTVVGGCPVKSLRRERGGVLARTPHGDVRAAHAILATNGTTHGAFAWVRRRVFPVPSFLIATEPVDPARLARLAPGGRMMVETRARHCYYRLSPDGRRIVFGGRAAMVPTDPVRAAARLRALMVDIWPDLADVRLTHAWSGMTGFTFAQLPHVGRHEGMVYALGYSGSGVALAPYLGMKAAYLALGDPRGVTAYQGTRLATRWLHPGGRPHFLAAADLWYRGIVDRREDAAASRDARIR